MTPRVDMRPNIVRIHCYVSDVRVRVDGTVYEVHYQRDYAGFTSTPRAWLLPADDADLDLATRLGLILDVKRGDVINLVSALHLRNGDEFIVSDGDHDGVPVLELAAQER